MKKNRALFAMKILGYKSRQSLVVAMYFTRPALSPLRNSNAANAMKSAALYAGRRTTTQRPMWKA